MTTDYQTPVEMLCMKRQKREKAEDKIKELEGTLKSAQDINDTYQRDTSRLQLRLTEVEEDNKKLAKQMEDLIIPRKHGM